MKRLLIAGGAGFIGANFVRHWLAAHPGDRVVVLDALTYAGRRASLSESLEREELRFVHGNICDTRLVETLLREEGLDSIVNFAAETHVDRSIDGPDLFVESNVIGTHSLLKAARRVWLDARPVPHRFHQVSTDEVYGALCPEDPPFTESNACAPNSPYSASKASGDHLVRAYHRTYGLDVTVSRCSNNYGPYQFPEKLIPLVVSRILAGGPVPVYGDGRQVRDWLHVSDHCRALELILTRGRAGQLYNIGGAAERENIALVQELCRIADRAFVADASLRARFPHSPAVQRRSASLIRFVSDRPGHDRRYAIDFSRARGEMGFAPRMPFDSGLEQTFRWYTDNEWWWRGSGIHCPLAVPADGSEAVLLCGA